MLDGSSSDALRDVAIEGGMEPMLIDGMRKVQEGVTTPAEVVKHAFSLFQS